MAAAAVPALTKAAPWVASAAGSFFGKKAAGPNAQQRAGMAQTSQGAQSLLNMGPSLQSTGEGMLYHGGQNIQNAARTGEKALPSLGRSTSALKQGGDYLSAAGNYYGKLLSGSRGAMREAVAPEMGQALDFYRGTEKKTARNLRGGSRDYALAELDRQKVGQLAMLPALARRGAAEGATNVAAGFRDQAGGERATAAGYGDLGQLYAALAGLDYGTGSSLTGQAANAYSGGGYLGNVGYGQGREVAQDARESGKGVGGFIFDIMQSLPWGRGRTPGHGGRFDVND